MNKRKDQAGRAGTDAASIRRWIVVYFAVLGGRAVDSIGLGESVADFDLDSVDAVELASEFAKAFGYELDPEFFLRGEQSLGEVIAGLAEVAKMR